MSTPHLVYFADPMCSWCYGFSPVIEALEARFAAALPIRLILGGLRPGTTEVMDERTKRSIREHWEHVGAASGQPFDFGFFERSGFVYDTEPASRAAVIARHRSMPGALAMLRALHRAFYAENRDVTDPEVLAALAAEEGFERDAFLAELASEAIAEETRGDFAIARQSGIGGFPTLIAGTGSGAPYTLLTQGFQGAEAMFAAIERWLEASANATA